MSTMSPHDVTDLAEQHFERWRRLHDERRFRVEQLDALDRSPPPATGTQASTTHSAWPPPSPSARSMPPSREWRRVDTACA